MPCSRSSRDVEGVVLGFWFFSQLRGGSSGVAYAAHVGGFLFGMAVGGLLRAATPKPPELVPTWR